VIFGARDYPSKKKSKSKKKKKKQEPSSSSEEEIDPIPSEEETANFEGDVNTYIF